jgi:hypothetical protein
LREGLATRCRHILAFRLLIHTHLSRISTSDDWIRASSRYRLRIGDDIRVFYDVTQTAVQVLAIVQKSDSVAWLAETEEIIITRHGKPAGMLRGFGSEGDWFEYKLENDPRFLQRFARPSELTGRRGSKA